MRAILPERRSLQSLVSLVGLRAAAVARWSMGEAQETCPLHVMGSAFCCPGLCMSHGEHNVSPSFTDVGSRDPGGQPSPSAFKELFAASSAAHAGRPGGRLPGADDLDDPEYGPKQPKGPEVC